jgi:hypothetical protein
VAREVKRMRPTANNAVSELADEIGLDDRAIPGGIPHQVNHPVAPHYPLDPGPYKDQFRGSLAHGVPGGSGGVKPKEDQFETGHKMATADPGMSYETQYLPVPLKPVPVYIVEKSTGQAPLTRISAYQILVPATGAIALCGRDLHRNHMTIFNEDSSNPVRIGYDGSAAEYGFYIAKASSSPRFENQDAVWATSPSGDAVYVSVLLEYGVAAGGGS